MTDGNIANSILTVHPCGEAAKASQDLGLPEGKSIAELLNDQQEKKDQNNTQENQETSDNITE